MKASVESVAAEREVAGLDIAPECKLYCSCCGKMQPVLLGTGSTEKGKK